MDGPVMTGNLCWLKLPVFDGGKIICTGQCVRGGKRRGSYSLRYCYESINADDGR